jgi:glycosyltransferase involved in cell wall biosynthesis
MTAATISVIVPAFNAARYLAEALDSLRRQTHEVFEIIVVDDGSTDDTARVLDAYAESIVAVRQQNAGAGAARNTGIGRATGKYIAFLDADDVCDPSRLERQVDLLEETPGAIACFTGHYTFNQDGRLSVFPVSSPAPGTDSLDFLSRCQFVGASVMFDRTRAAGLRFPEDARAAGEDIIFGAELASRGQIVAVASPLYGYRLHSTQQSIGFQADASSNLFFEYRYEWARRHWRDYWPDRTWQEVADKLWEGLVDQTEAAYWARHRKFFLNDRNYLRQHWPATLPRPAVLSWRWYPDWLWAAKNHLDAWRHRYRK